MTSLHWQTGLQNRQCHALCTLGKTSKCWLGLRPIWVCEPFVMVLRVLMLHGGSTNPCGDVTPWGRVAEGWSCCSWWSGQMVKLPENRIAWGQVAPADHPTLGWTLGHGFIPYWAPCNPRLCFALHTSFRQKCLKLRCHDFSALADWSPKQTMSCTLHAW